MAVSAQWGTASDKDKYFGQVDYKENIARGYTPLEIFNYLISNPQQLRGPDVPGGGGVYDKALEEAVKYRADQALQQGGSTSSPGIDLSSIEAKNKELQNQLNTLTSDFDKKIKDQMEQAKKEQRNLMISMQQQAAPASVRMATPSTQQQQLMRRGTTGYFGRQGLRIGSLNVPGTPQLSP